LLAAQAQAGYHPGHHRAAQVHQPSNGSRQGQNVAHLPHAANMQGQNRAHGTAHGSTNAGQNLAHGTHVASVTGMVLLFTVDLFKLFLDRSLFCSSFKVNLKALDVFQAECLLIQL